MRRKKGYKVIPQMFDVKPVDETGSVDVAKIGKIEKVLKLRQEKTVRKISKEAPKAEQRSEKKMLRRGGVVGIIPKAQSYQLGRIVSKQKRVPHLIQSSYQAKRKINFYDIGPKKEASLESFFGKKKGCESKKNPKFDFNISHQAKNPKSDGLYDAKRNLTAKIEINTLGANKLPVPFQSRAENGKEKRDVFTSEFDPVIFDNYFGVPQKFQVADGIKLDKDSLLARSEKPEEKSEGLFSDALSKRSVKKRSKPSGTFSHIFSNYKSISKRALRKIRAGSFLKFPVLRPALSFAVMSAFISVFVLSGLFVSKGMVLKEDILVKGQTAVGYIAQAKTDLENKDFESVGNKLDSAKKEFEEAEKEIVFLGGGALDIFSGLPYLSKISSGKNIIEAGKFLTEAGKEVAYVAQIFSQIDNPLAQLNQQSNQTDGEKGGSLTDVMLNANEHITKANQFLVKAKESLDKVNPEDLPAEYRMKFEKIKSAMPLVIGTISGFEQNYQIFLDILGHNGPRKYLFLFQNNQEMRATGGFIGSYGILDINDGHIRNLFIDGIFNPDGQLSERVVPPKPIQKVSAVWTMHDSNWFANFPTSAEKAAWFYEKTGGPTVDGVISLTPTVMQKMLEITGPIEMPEYETTVDKDNFIEKTQYEVEVDYDKDLNKPKQFIADLAPKILDRVFSVRNPEQISKVFRVLSESLKEKHVLIYSNNYNLQKIISDQGWSGEILQTSKDFLMVVNSNINGYKTDGVIDETITHKAEIQSDGSIVDTVKIKRVHNGGDTQYEWWNKVNADYLRIYVPKGSQLISAKGQTREFNQSPIDYDQLGFRRDAQVQKEELSMKVDEQTGTRIYEEENKTVFANWVYVSPKETVELEYQYLLPFKLNPGEDSNGSDGYSLLAQKQSGSSGSDFSSQVVFPENLKIIWKYPESLESGQSELKFNGKLQQDRFFGAVFGRN